MLSGHHPEQVNGPLVDPLRSQEAEATGAAISTPRLQSSCTGEAALLTNNTSPFRAGDRGGGKIRTHVHLVLLFGITRRR
jgi:hypothetical protein